MKNKTIFRSLNIHDYIHFTYNGIWVVKYGRYVNYKLVIEFENCYLTGCEAVEALIKYCDGKGIKYREFDVAAWTRYYTDADSHLFHMMKKKGKVSEGEWEMAFSCDAPNKPGSQFANND